MDPEAFLNTQEMYDRLKEIIWVFQILISKGSVAYQVHFTGFALSASGLVMTCGHGLTGDPSHKIGARRLGDENFIYNAQVVSEKLNWDIALLHIKDVKDCKFGRLAKDGSLSVGQRLYHIGNPLMFVGSFLMGKVAFPCFDNVDIPDANEKLGREYKSNALNTALRYRIMGDLQHRSLGDEKLASFMMNLDPHVPVIQLYGFGLKSGCSGGPIFNAKGEIVGLCSSSSRTFEFAIHVSALKFFLKQLKGGGEGRKEKPIANPSAHQTDPKGKGKAMISFLEELADLPDS